MESHHKKTQESKKQMKPPPQKKTTAQQKKTIIQLYKLNEITSNEHLETWKTRFMNLKAKENIPKNQLNHQET